MNMKKTGVILLATTLSFAGISYAVAGNHNGKHNKQGCTNQMTDMNQGKHRGSMKHQGMGFSKLDLTKTQKQEMREIMKSAKGEKENRNSESKIAHRASMQTLISSDSFDEQAAKELISAQQLERAEKQLRMLKAKHEMFQVLTDEQKLEYSELQTSGKNR